MVALHRSLLATLMVVLSAEGRQTPAETAHPKGTDIYRPLSGQKRKLPVIMANTGPRETHDYRDYNLLVPGTT